MLLAKAASFFLGPLFMLFPVPFILVSKFTNDYYYALKWTVFSYSFIIVVAIFVMIGVLLGFFSNFDVSKREQRPLLFGFSAFIMLCYLLSLIIFNGPRILFLALFTIILGLIVLVVVNIKIKASIHLATATSVILLTTIAYRGYFLFLLPLIPILAWARIKTKEHTLSETVIGIILGVVLTVIMYTISSKYFMALVSN